MILKRMYSMLWNWSGVGYRAVGYGVMDTDINNLNIAMFSLGVKYKFGN